MNDCLKQKNSVVSLYFVPSFPRTNKLDYSFTLKPHLAFPSKNDSCETVKGERVW